MVELAGWCVSRCFLFDRAMLARDAPKGVGAVSDDRAHANRAKLINKISQFRIPDLQRIPIFSVGDVYVHTENNDVCLQYAPSTPYRSGKAALNLRLLIVRSL